MEHIVVGIGECLKVCGQDVHKHVFSDISLPRMFRGLQPF